MRWRILRRSASAIIPRRSWRRSTPWQATCRSFARAPHATTRARPISGFSILGAGDNPSRSGPSGGGEGLFGGRTECHRHPREAPHIGRVHPVEPGLVDGEIGHRAEDLLQRDLSFQPRQMHAKTGMQAETEAQMVLGVTPDVISLGIIELALIAVGRDEE